MTNNRIIALTAFPSNRTAHCFPIINRYTAGHYAIRIQYIDITLYPLAMCAHWQSCVIEAIVAYACIASIFSRKHFLPFNVLLVINVAPLLQQGGNFVRVCVKEFTFTASILHLERSFEIKVDWKNLLHSYLPQHWSNWLWYMHSGFGPLNTSGHSTLAHRNFMPLKNNILNLNDFVRLILQW